MKEKNIILQFDDKNDEDNKYYYIYLRKDIKDNHSGQSVKQVTYDGFGSEEAKKEKLEFIVDFDKNDKIVGIEVVSNRDIIPDELK